MFKKIAVLSLLLIFTGCASTIGNQADLSQAQFVLGESTKQDVGNFLGLPADVQKSTKKGYEYWSYTAKAKLTGIMFAAPTGGTHTQAINIKSSYDTIDDDVAILDSAVITYIFDQNNVLIDAIDKRKNQENK